MSTAWLIALAIKALINATPEQIAEFKREALVMQKLR
jgi:hypothetical protein